MAYLLLRFPTTLHCLTFARLVFPLSRQQKQQHALRRVHDIGRVYPIIDTFTTRYLPVAFELAQSSPLQ